MHSLFAHTISYVSLLHLNIKNGPECHTHCYTYTRTFHRLGYFCIFVMQWRIVFFQSCYCYWAKLFSRRWVHLNRAIYFLLKCNSTLKRELLFFFCLLLSLVKKHQVFLPRIIIIFLMCNYHNCVIGVFENSSSINN